MAALSPVAQKFILHWGEMGTRWGINRTVAQVHALLYLSPRPLHAEEITEMLSVSRSNVSTSLRELQAWGIVKVVHVLGDRRDHFETMKEVGEMFQIIMDERKKREIDPTLEILRQCVAEAEAAGTGESYSRKRLNDMLEFVETVTNGYSQLRRLPADAMSKLLKAGGNAKKLLAFAGR